MKLRVVDISACYRLWKSRGTEFITEPLDKYSETRCYIGDPDGYIIEVAHSKPDFTAVNAHGKTENTYDKHQIGNSCGSRADDIESS